MAKTQRWRRGRPAGEDTSSVEEQVDPAEASAPEGTAAEVPLEADLDADPDAGLEPDLEADLDPDLEAESEAESEAEPDLDDAALEADLDPDAETGLDEVDDAEADAEDEDDDFYGGVVEPTYEPATGLVGVLFGGRNPAEVVPLQLLQAAHAKQAIGTAVAMGLVAAIAGRPAREAGVVLLAVLVGQTILGWHNDIVDRQRDKSHGLKGKPLAMGRLQPETVWYAIVVATLLLVPLSITTGIRAGCLYLAAVAVGMLGNIVLRTGFFSWWSWAASFALLPAYLSYGGWGGQAVGSAPETSIVVLSALLGIGIHFLRAVWGLVADHEDGWTYLPLKLGLKLGATRLLALATLYTAVITILLVVMGAKVGLSR
ncbi:UbiA family prenyltransferase [Nocardioides sp. CPCC 206347]|uniref:UbiA family prenyltransferase n=1 Tax=Nocardioides sp. CPCC 206347 TaxID=3406463 RepID=UPI003B434DF1